MIFRLAIRNLTRHHRRSLITASSVMFGSWLSLTTIGIGNYTYNNMIDDSATMGFGHVAVLPDGYLKEPSLKLAISQAETVEQKIAATGLVRQILPRIMGAGMASTASNNRGIQFIAIDPEKESAKTSLLLKHIHQGKLFTRDDHQGALIGARLAKNLNLKIGKKFVLTTTDITGEVVTALFRVRGIFRTGLDETDGYSILVSLPGIQKVLSYRPDQLTMLSLLIHDQRNTPEVVQDLSGVAAVPGQTFLGWRETQPDLAGFVAIDRGGNQVFLIFLGLLIGLGVLNTMFMSVMERIRVFGCMLALGLPPGILIRSVMLESVLLSTGGLLAGSAIALVCDWLLRTRGLDLSFLLQEGTSAAGVIFDPVLRSLLFANDFLVVWPAFILMTVLASIVPAIRAGRLQPVEAMTHR